MAFIILKYIPLYSFWWEFFFKSWVDVEFCQMLFLHLLKWSCIFCLSFCYCDVSNWLICICWTMLVVLKWIQFDCGIWALLCIIEFGLLIFFEDFYIYIHQRYWPVILFSGSVFVYFLCRGDSDLIEWIWECFLLFSLLEYLEKDRCTFFFVCLVEFPSEAEKSGLALLLQGVFLKIVDFISLLCLLTHKLMMAYAGLKLKMLLKCLYTLEDMEAVKKVQSNLSDS